MSISKAARTLGFAAELAAIGAAGLLELLSPRDKSGEHFAGAAASLADGCDPPGGLLRNPSVREDKQHGMRRDTQPGRVDPHSTWGIETGHDIGCTLAAEWFPQHTKSPQPSPVTTHTSAGDNSSAAAGTLPPTAAAEPLTWLGWAVPAILDVLAEHHLHREKSGQQVCLCDLRTLDHPDDWREHVAPLIAERIACNPARAIAALENFQPK